MLNLRAPSRDRLMLLDVQKPASAQLLAHHSLGQIASVLLAVFLVLFVNLEYQLLHAVTSDFIFVIESGTDAQMEWISALFFARAFSEAATLATQAELHDIARLWRISAAKFYDTLHIDALCPDKPSCHLEILVVFDLNVESAGVLYCRALVIQIC